MDEMLKYMNNLIEKAKNWTTEDLETLKYMIIGGFVVDLLGIYWFLGWKRIALGILMVLIMFFVIILILDRRKLDEDLDKIETIEEPKKPIKIVKKIKREPVQVVKESSYRPESTESSFRLPSSDEMELRIRQALS